MRALLITICAGLLLTSHAQAEPQYTSPLSVTGYISQGWYKSSANKIAGNSDNKWGSFAKREVGLFASYEVNPLVDLRVAPRIEQTGERDDQHFELVHALVDIHCPEGSSGLRFGKVRHTVGFYNQTRDNPGVRDLDMSPQTIYKDRIRNMVASGVGAQLYSEQQFNDLSVSFEYTHTHPTIYPKSDVASVFFIYPTTGSIEKSSKIDNVTLTFKGPAWTFIYGRSLFDLDFTRSATDVIPSQAFKVRSYYMGYRRYYNKFDVTAELVRTANKFRPQNLLGGPSSPDPTGYALSARYHFDTTTSLIVERGFWYQSDRVKNMMAPLHIPNSVFDGNYSAISVRHASNRWIYRASFHKVVGTNDLSLTENGFYISAPRYNYLSASATYLF